MVLAACGGSVPRPSDSAVIAQHAGAELAIARGRCGNCHALPAELAGRLAPLPAPSLTSVGARRAGPSLAQFLLGHYSGGKAAADDLAAYLQSQSGGRVELQSANVVPGGVEMGRERFLQFGCRACHAESGINGLAERTDFANVVAFLTKPLGARADLDAHDFGIEGNDASAIATWLLRDQQVDADHSAAQPGLLVESFELPVKDAKLPVLDGLTPKLRKVVSVIDESPHSREDNFVLQFLGELAVPVTGDYMFEVGADDAAWLFLDGKLVVDNAAIAPFRQRKNKLNLLIGSHPIRIVFAEAGGGQRLEVKWRGPDFELQPIAPTALSAKVSAMVPVAMATMPEPAAVARGQTLFVAQRCGACHGVADKRATATPWAALKDAACTAGFAKEGIYAAARAALQWPRDARSDLSFSMQRDGCVACHSRDGQGGMSQAARSVLAEVEDIGDEGRVPPDLSQVGHRLQPDWLFSVLREGRKARPYVLARMLKLKDETAQQYAALFTTLDAVKGDEQEPAFSEAAVTEGARLAGTGAFNCATCHSFGGRRAIGPQGMDMAQQFARLRPGWFREWLLAPTKGRPLTRMPTLWQKGDAADLLQVDALRSWLSMGSAAPVPIGYSNGGRELVLDPIGAPRLHGAFLAGLSARCLAIGTKERTHYAYDLNTGQLAWLWRGDFLDADGTWSGRAGRLLTPLGTDWVTLDKNCVFTNVADAAAKAQLIGWEVAADGLPVFHWRVGSATIDDAAHPLLRSGGTNLVRMIAARDAAVRLVLPTGDAVKAFVSGKAVGEVVIPAGGRVEVVYQW